MFAVGLTGGIGSGKSTVAALFAEQGAAVIDTDAISHQLTAPGGAALGEIHTQFGDAVMQEDGTLDRAALRRRIFSDTAARRQLEAILHPRIRQQVEQALATVAAPYALVVIPLLLEAGGYREMLNRILVIDCPEEVQMERVMVRSGLTRDEVSAILTAQARRSERLTLADDVILNTVPLETLRIQVAALHRRYLALSAAQLP